MTKKVFSYVLVLVFAFVLTAQTTPKTVHAALALPQCQDGLDNDSDGLIDNSDPQCHTDGDASNSFSYDANIDNEASPSLIGGGLALPQCQDGIDNDSDGKIDDTDPQCHTDGDISNPFSYDANIDNEASPTVIVVPPPGGGGGGGGGGVIYCTDTITTFCTQRAVPQVLGASTGPQVLAATAVRPVVLQKTGGLKIFAYVKENIKAIKLAVREDNRLVIPKLNVDKPILQMNNINALRSESWILPWTSTPDQGSNTVIVGHSYDSLNSKFSKSTFYDLDKLNKGDEIKVSWKGKDYRYVVVEKGTVKPTDTRLEDKSDSAILTIYGCGKFTNTVRNYIKAELQPVGLARL